MTSKYTVFLTQVLIDSDARMKQKELKQHFLTNFLSLYMTQMAGKKLKTSRTKLRHMTMLHYIILYSILNVNYHC